MIGTQELAEEAYLLYQIVKPSLYDEVMDIADDPDWKYLSSGSFRHAFLHKPTRTVYKIGDNFCNAVEVGFVAALIDTPLPDGWRLPLTDGYMVEGMVIVAMEYIPQLRGPFVAHGSEYFTENYDFRDMYCDNVKMDEDGNFVPVDLGNCGVLEEHGWRQSFSEMFGLALTDHGP